MHEQVQTDELQSQPLHTEPLDTSSTVESALAESLVTGTEEPEASPISDDPTVPLAPPQRYFQVNWWSIVALFLLLILAGEHIPTLMMFLAQTYFRPTATVTLFPTQKRMSQAYTFLAVTGTADPGQQQIPSRLLSFTTPTTTETITTTGVGHTPPVQATGSVTLYNEAPYSQTVYAGTVLTGSDGIHVVTDETVTISAGNGATNGSATVRAHTIQAGTQANIAPLALNGLCCLSGIYVKNTSGFTGGEDPKTYPMVSQADVAAATKHLAGTPDPLAKDAIGKQMRATEQRLLPFTCTSQTTATPNVGEQATTARVAVSETCLAQVIDFATLQALTTTHFLQDGVREVGSGFTTKGEISLSLGNSKLLDKSHHTYALAVTVSGTMIFHLTASQLQSLALQMAGKKIDQARTALLRMQGIQGVYIQPGRESDTTFPTDPGQIHIIVS